MTKILIVEDEKAIADVEKAYIIREGFDADTASDGAEALRMFNEGSYDLVLLDLMLPGIKGERVCEEIRRTSGVPIIMVTAKSGEDDVIAGLDAGADDYILKPFDMQELEARLRAVLRRPGSRVSTLLRCNNLAFEPETRHLSVDGNTRITVLARREAMLLEEMLRIAPRIVIKEQLEERLYAFNEPVTLNAIEALVSRLRRKLSEAGAHSRIETVRGLGYRLLSVDNRA
jgi:DNA-binding response OmpR family regulator